MKTAQDYKNALEHGVSSVMVGRGAVGNPFLFREVQGGRTASKFEKLEMELEHARLNVEWYGERSGLRQLRKVLIGYTADFPELRSQVTAVETLEALEGVLLPLLERLVPQNFPPGKKRESGQGQPLAVSGYGSKSRFKRT